MTRTLMPLSDEEITLLSDVVIDFDQVEHFVLLVDISYVEVEGLARLLDHDDFLVLVHWFENQSGELPST